MPDDGITLVFLTRGKVALIDTIDATRVLRHQWIAIGSYAGRWMRTPERKVLLLHTVIADCDPGLEPDHINRNKLDNRRGNLRCGTHSQNGANWPQRAGTSGYRGVGAWQGRWRAKATLMRKCIHIGMFSTPEEAARAYDVFARQTWGEFATLNFPDDI